MNFISAFGCFVKFIKVWTYWLPPMQSGLREKSHLHVAIYLYEFLPTRKIWPSYRGNAVCSTSRGSRAPGRTATCAKFADTEMCMILAFR